MSAIVFSSKRSSNNRGPGAAADWHVRRDVAHSEAVAGGICDARVLVLESGVGTIDDVRVGAAQQPVPFAAELALDDYLVAHRPPLFAYSVSCGIVMRGISTAVMFESGK